MCMNPFRSLVAVYLLVFRPSKLLQECQHYSIRPTETSLHCNMTKNRLESVRKKRTCMPFFYAAIRLCKTKLSFVVLKSNKWWVVLPGVCISHHHHIHHTFPHYISHALLLSSCTQHSWFWSTSQQCLLLLFLLLLMQISTNLQLSCAEVEPNHLGSPWAHFIFPLER